MGGVAGVDVSGRIGCRRLAVFPAERHLHALQHRGEVRHQVRRVDVGDHRRIGVDFGRKNESILKVSRGRRVRFAGYSVAGCSADHGDHCASAGSFTIPASRGDGNAGAVGQPSVQLHFAEPANLGRILHGAQCTCRGSRNRPTSRPARRCWRCRALPGR